MFTPTIYFPEIDSKTQTMPLEDSKLHHLKKVLRIKDFDSVNISNGQGQLFTGKFVNSSGDQPPSGPIAKVCTFGESFFNTRPVISKQVSNIE